MKFVRNLIYSQYYELKKKERPLNSAKTTALILATVMLVLVVVAVFMLILVTGVADGFESPWSGSATGRVAGILVFALCFGIVYFVYGRPEKYNALIKSYEALPESEQEKTYKHGMKQFALVFVILMLVIIGLGIMA